MQLRMGKFKQPFNLEEQTSSNNIDFMERSYVNQIAPAKKIGAMIYGEPVKGFTYAASTYAMNDTELDQTGDKANFAGRTTLNAAELTGNKDAIMHVGLAGFNNEYNVQPTSSSGTASVDTRANVLAFRTPGQGLNSIFRAQIGGRDLGTSQQSGISNHTAQIKSNAVGLEGAFALKNFKLQGEFARSNFKGDYSNSTEFIDMDAKMYYGEVMWLATGEKYSDAYKAGAFSSIKPINNFDFDKNQWGALEFGLRAERYTVDNMNAGRANGAALSEVRVQGTSNCNGAGQTEATTEASIDGCKSTATTYTAGLKWILNPNAMIKLNYSRTNFGDDFKYYDVAERVLNKENLLMMRTQYTF
jgi:phosphate-selective porin OprO/OprP